MFRLMLRRNLKDIISHKNRACITFTSRRKQEFLKLLALYLVKQYHKTFKKPESVQGKSRSTSKSFVMALGKVVNTKTSQMKMTPTFELECFFNLIHVQV